MHYILIAIYGKYNAQEICKNRVYGSISLLCFGSGLLLFGFQPSEIIRRSAG